MRSGVLAVLVAAAGGACASPSKQAACDVPAVAEEAAYAPSGVAQATRGGQEVKNGADARDLSRTTPRITTGTGSGPTTSSTADNETRHTTSGGALACAFNAQTDPMAMGGGGGQSLATQKAAAVVDSLNAALVAAIVKGDVAMAQFLAEQIEKAQGRLSASAVNDRPNIVNTYNQDHVRNVQVPFSTSATDGEATGSATTSAK